MRPFKGYQLAEWVSKRTLFQYKMSLKEDFDSNTR